LPREISQFSELESSNTGDRIFSRFALLGNSTGCHIFTQLADSLFDCGVGRIYWYFKKHAKGLLMFSEIIIKIQHLSKYYQIYDQPNDRLKQFFYPRLKRLLGNQHLAVYYKEFRALDNINFEIKKGETVGIIGRNGSGKSTLLQLICGTLNPTSGKVQTQGRIAALLELGSGFNPEFTGYENVYLNASLLGLSKVQIDEVYPEIVAFADIGDFSRSTD
jgi:ABC-type multidrug transport system fused ATPase/permease subunit